MRADWTRRAHVVGDQIRAFARKPDTHHQMSRSGQDIGREPTNDLVALHRAFSGAETLAMDPLRNRPDASSPPIVGKSCRHTPKAGLSPSRRRGLGCGLEDHAHMITSAAHVPKLLTAEPTVICRGRSRALHQNAAADHSHPRSIRNDSSAASLGRHGVDDRPPRDFMERTASGLPSRSRRGQPRSGQLDVQSAVRHTIWRRLAPAQPQMHERHVPDRCQLGRPSASVEVEVVFAPEQVEFNP